MPQVKFSGLITAMKGKAGGSIFSQNKQGAYFRNNKWGGGRKSPRWNAAKNRLQTLSNSWRLLSDEQRDAWEKAAVNYPFENKFKEEYIGSGYQVYMSLNGTLLAQNLPTLSVPGENRPFPEDITFDVSNPKVPWVTGGTGATFPPIGGLPINYCDPWGEDTCPWGFECFNGVCKPQIDNNDWQELRQAVKNQFYQFADPECTSDADCVDAGLSGASADVACQDGKCVYVGDGLMYYERTSYVLNIADALLDGGVWNHTYSIQDTLLAGSFRFTLGPATLQKLNTTTQEIVLVSNYYADGRGSSIRLVPQDKTTTRIFFTFGLGTGTLSPAAATYVWHIDVATSELQQNSVLQFKINPGDTVNSFMCLNGSGFNYGQFQYWEGLKTGFISTWGRPEGTNHNPYSDWETLDKWFGFVYGAGVLGLPNDVIYSDIRFFSSNYTEFKYALSGMLLGNETIVITASGDSKPSCSYKSCSQSTNFCGDNRTKCNCAAGICGPWKQISDLFSNKAPGGNSSIHLVAAVPIYNVSGDYAAGYTFTFADYWLNQMGGQFANNGATFVPLTTANIGGTTESGFALIVSVTRAKGSGTTIRKTEFIDMALLPADVSDKWELWEYIKPAIASAPPGTVFWVAFNVVDTTTGRAQCRSKKTIRFKAGAELSSSVN